MKEELRPIVGYFSSGDDLRVVNNIECKYRLVGWNKIIRITDIYK